MNASNAKPFRFLALALALLGGATLAMAFAPFEVSGAAAVAPGIVLVAALLQPAAAFRLGYLAALTANLIELRWLLNIPVPFAPILGWFALSAFLALYTGLWTWLCARVAPSFGVTASPQESASERRPPTTLLTFAFPLFAAAAWTAIELISGKLLSGFPWNHLGHTQHAQIPLIQLAAITGVPGISFLLVWFSAALVTAAVSIRERGIQSHLWKLQFLPPLIVIAVVMAYGLRVTLRATPESRSVKLAMVQPSVPQTMIWDSAANTNRFRELLELSAQAVTNAPDIVLWPEAGLPGFLNHDEWVFTPVSEFARKHRVWIICGADDAAPRENGAPNEADFFNSAFLMNREGRLVAKYDKQQLVMFGEYVPLTRWLPFLKWFTPITGGFTPGKAPETFELGDLDVRTSVIICFEDVFANVARRAAAAGVDFLINLTNDGWFGEAAAQRQQAACAVFRAVENGVPVVRCTNNGLTCWIDARGRMRDFFRDATGSIYGKGVFTTTLQLPAQRPGATFYQRHGDWFAWLCAAMTVGIGAPLLWGARQRKSPPAPARA